MKILILSSNLSNEAGGYSESSFLLRERLELIHNDVYLLGFWKSKYFGVNYKLTDKINIFLPGLIEKFPFSYRYLKKIFSVKPQIIDIQGDELLINSDFEGLITSLGSNQIESNSTIKSWLNIFLILL